MAQYLGVHKLNQDMSEEELRNGYSSYKEAAVARGLKPDHAHFSLKKSFAYCVTEAPSAEDVRAAHSNANIPLEDVIEIKTIE